MSGFQRWLPYLAVALFLTALVGVADVIYSRGRDAGRAEVQTVLDAERDAHVMEVSNFLTEADTRAFESDLRLASTLKAQKEFHDATTAQLRAALDASALRTVRLTADLARLHDAAARGADPGPATGAAGASGGPAGTAEAGTEALSVADLIETADENYGICHRNSARLAEIQEWYRSLRDKTTAE